MIKKLTLITLVTFGTPFVTQAYDADKLKQQVESITAFAQELRQQNSPESNDLATWLTSKVLDESNTTDRDIIAMAAFATKNQSKTESQIAALSKKVGYIIAYLFATTLGGIAASYWYYDYLQKKRNSGWL